jgi:hypothetical protein
LKASRTVSSSFRRAVQLGSLSNEEKVTVLSTKTLDDSPTREDKAAISPDRKRLIESSTSSSKMRFISKAVLFLRVFAFAAAVPYLLRLKLSTVARALEPGRDPSAVHEDRVRKIAGYVEIAIRHGRPFVRPGCLTRGLTRYYFLRRAGMNVALCFGMGRLENQFIGHCWLVNNGEPFLEVEDPRPRYVEMYRISREGGRASTLAGACEPWSLSNS